MQNIQSDSNIVRQEENIPVLGAADAASYLSELLPQMANIARKSGMSDVAELILLAANLARKSKTD